MALTGTHVEGDPGMTDDDNLRDIAISATTIRLRDLFVNVLGEGVMGDCSGTAGNGTDDTAAINAAITANPGKVLLFPAGRTYRIVTGQLFDNDHSGGIKLNQAGTVLSCYGATFVMDTSTYQHYQMVDVTAADCSILGGRFVGDVVAHTGTAGEWGYAISVGAGSHRFRAKGVYATKCWGDGFFVFERPTDVVFESCVSDDNRRQGISIIDAIRPRIEGGAYINTGLTKYMAPGAGIDLEPDAGSSRDVVDALISGVMLSGNAGAGILTTGGVGRICTAQVVGCEASGNTLYGFESSGYAVTTFTGCRANDNAEGGFGITYATVAGTTFNACTAQSNKFGFVDGGTRSNFSACVAVDNLNAGIRLTGDSPTVSGFLAIGNCTVGTFDNVQIHTLSPNTTMTACVSQAGSNAIKPAYGIVISDPATGARLLGCDASGAFTSGAFLDQTTGTTAVTLPKPGTAGGVSAIATGTTNFVFGGDNTLTQAITFPSGRFSSVPVLTPGIGLSGSGCNVLGVHFVSLTTAGCTMIVATEDASAYTGTVIINWIAIQE